jgi:hypothetical protein
VPRRAPVGNLALPAVLAAVILLGLGSVGAPLARGTPPPLPLGDDRAFVQNLTGAEVTAGGGGTISLEVYDPLSEPMTGVVLAVGEYAFNAFPGNATSGVDVASAPVLSNASASALEVNASLGSIAPGHHADLAVPVQTSTSTPSGTFAVRLSMRFVENGSSYLLASRGWFTAAEWSAATTGPNGTVDVNLTLLGVSGILPETSILVSSNGFSYLLWTLLGVGGFVVAAGAWLYFRRSNSSAGTRPSPEATQAPRAFGKRRTKDGD